MWGGRELSTANRSVAELEEVNLISLRTAFLMRFSGSLFAGMQR